MRIKFFPLLLLACALLASFGCSGAAKQPSAATPETRTEFIPSAIFVSAPEERWAVRIIGRRASWVAVEIEKRLIAGGFRELDRRDRQSFSPRTYVRRMVIEIDETFSVDNPRIEILVEENDWLRHIRLSVRFDPLKPESFDTVFRGLEVCPSALLQPVPTDQKEKMK